MLIAEWYDDGTGVWRLRGFGSQSEVRWMFRSGVEGWFWWAAGGRDGCCETREEAQKAATECLQSNYREGLESLDAALRKMNGTMKLSWSFDRESNRHYLRREDGIHVASISKGQDDRYYWIMGNDLNCQIENSLQEAKR